jgi:hypothetical protein
VPLLKAFLGFARVQARRRIRCMHNRIRKFVEAHDRYLALDNARTECKTPQEREIAYIEILTAYLEVQHHARQITGLQFADGMDFAEAH